ncbi:CerR family C-terminal domain-containing protein [Rhodoferax mekongensis]|uniref:CerR family C-terminal domain-containing protein n=1 Tax=Rhodoferax mekongensis TaxID=3068341 RepID=A0ABZ0B3W1_9BURK|nr:MULTISPECIES: CerR family C-terminal domain-containing protein [unclassified Rhodoferax]MDT7516087.1 CerR family C-terminal domain-containing protein [Rhodoferax sp. TBRC 17199]WNO06599.1 CerR family C-terminal domain-containing protein [Rhodoferax sp. TBRC 17307]
MPIPLPETVSAVKPMRSDGVEARNRLLDAALQLFAEQGFAKTSIREIALAAQANVASISYYFGDKAGLYRAVFSDPRTNPPLPPEALEGTDVTLEQAIRGLLSSFLEPLKNGHVTQQQYMKLCFREMLEPTGAWQHEIDTNIAPAHMALTRGLCRHVGLAEADDDIHRLAFTISGLGVMLHVGNDLYTQIRPGLVNTPQALDAYLDRLVSYALVLVDAEALRRRAQAPAPAHSPEFISLQAP